MIVARGASALTGSRPGGRWLGGNEEGWTNYGFSPPPSKPANRASDESLRGGCIESAIE
jgi:hypothetical protein